MEPYEALYNRKSQTPLRQAKRKERVILGIEVIKVIQKRMKVVRDRVFIEISPMKIIVRTGKARKLRPKYISPFFVTKRIA